MQIGTSAGSAKAWKTAGTVLSLAIFVFALWLLRRAVAKYEFTDIVARLVETPATAVALSLAAALGSYLALGGFDWLAVRHIKRRVPVGLTLLGSFISHAVSHSAGFAALTGGAIRYRIYAAAGLTALEVAAVIVFCGFTFILGAAALAAAALALEPGKFAGLTRLPEGALRLAGIAVLGLLAAYLVASAVRRAPIRLWRRSFSLPGPRTAVLQIVVAALDLSFAAAALHVLLPPGAPPLWAFVGIYVLANLAGVVAHVPGGLGVFETAVVLMLPEVPADATLGALVLFRVTYNLVPLALGAVLMALYEMATRRRQLGRAARVAREWLRELEPPALSVLVFAAGAMLLLTGAAPDDPVRLALALDWLPVPVLQGAHLIAAGAGAGLLLAARGLFRRLYTAYVAALVLLAVGGLTAALRALDYEEALAAAMLMLMLLAARPAFYRRRSVAALGYSSGWIGAGAAILIATAWLTALAFRSAAEPIDPWLLAEVELDGAARAFRAFVAGVTVYVATLALAWQQSRTARPALPDEAALAQAARIIERSPSALANRALLGDFYLMFEGPGDAFLMYRTVDRHWIALGEPAGPEEHWTDLVWSFREACESAGAQPIFFHVAQRPLYLDLGLGFVRIGEEGRVALPAFSLDDPAHAELRRRHAAALREGARFEVVPAGRATALIPALHAISEAWLAGSAGEIGRLLRFPLAVVRADGAVVAFAPLWQAAPGTELAVDAVRHAPGAERMEDFLVLEAIAWGRSSGYRSFDLGLAAAPDLHDPVVAPLIKHFSPLAYRQWVAARRFHDRYAADWRPVYAALPAGTALPAVAAAMAGPQALRALTGLPAG